MIESSCKADLGRSMGVFRVDIAAVARRVNLLPIILYGMVAHIAIGPEEGDCWCKDGDPNSYLVVLVVEEGRATVKLGPWITSKTSHWLSTYLYTPNLSPHQIFPSTKLSLNRGTNITKVIAEVLQDGLWLRISSFSGERPLPYTLTLHYCFFRAHDPPLNFSGRPRPCSIWSVPIGRIFFLPWDSSVWQEEWTVSLIYCSADGLSSCSVQAWTLVRHLFLFYPDWPGMSSRFCTICRGPVLWLLICSKCGSTRTPWSFGTRTSLPGPSATCIGTCWWRSCWGGRGRKIGSRRWARSPTSCSSTIWSSWKKNSSRESRGSGRPGWNWYEQSSWGLGTCSIDRFLWICPQRACSKSQIGPTQY